VKEYQKEAKLVKGEQVQKKLNKEVEQTVKVVDSERLHEMAEEGLAALAFELGLDVLQQLFEQDVEDIAGPKGKHDINRTAYRHGTEQTKVVFADKKISIKKPRVREDGHDVPLPSLKMFQKEDPLNSSIVNRLLCGVSTRKYSRTVDTKDGYEVACVSKSETSRRFITGLKKLMDEFFDRQLLNTYPAIMVDGMVRGNMTIIVALGITSEGKKEILGLTEGGTENSETVKSLFSDLIERGLNVDIPRLFTLDGSKALSKAVRDIFGKNAEIQRCQVHKKHNVLSHLPLSEQANIGLAISRAYMEFEYDKAYSQLNQIANNLDNRYPSAATSLREGLEETLTVHRLMIPGLLRKTLSNTNAIESANSIAASIVRRVKRWRNGEMILRHMAAGFLEAERSFRRVSGYREIPLLEAALTANAGGSSAIAPAVAV
jgi:transposase-like protein